MTLLDAYALIAFVAGGPARAEVREILRSGDAGIATANLVEVLDVCSRVKGLAIERVLDVIDPLFEAALREVPLDGGRARHAASIRATHYHRESCPISLADAVLLASASAGDRIATADPDVLAVAAAEGIEPLALPAGG